VKGTGWVIGIPSGIETSMIWNERGVARATTAGAVRTSPLGLGKADATALGPDARSDRWASTGAAHTKQQRAMSRRPRGIGIVYFVWKTVKTIAWAYGVAMPPGPGALFKEYDNPATWNWKVRLHELLPVDVTIAVNGMS
jgi:hypothetical protein